ncbi:glutamate--tRNA ligase [soil metagenome]
MTSTDQSNAAKNLSLVRVRFPPSPTGLLHVGGARTALFNWLFAYGQAPRQHKNGQLIIRIEDTDRSRFVPGAAEGMLDILDWFGLIWDEGPDKGGPVGPYVQSERTALYQEHAQQLIDSGTAYRCFCTPERLQQLREEQQARKQAPGYDRICRSLDQGEISQNLAAGMSFVIRFTMPREGETIVDDFIRGPMAFQNVNLEDLVLLKTDGYPTYHLANVVDDHHMNITHIMRGDEWIPTAPVHVQLYHAFGWDVPVLAHMPLILAPGGGKLSKRHGSTAMEEFRSQGYLPEALMNYLALLGWSFDGQTEIFSKYDLLEKFTIERVSPSPATFDYSKLRWFNQHYINHILTLDDLTERVIPFLVEQNLVSISADDVDSPDFTRVRDVVSILKDRIELLADAPCLMSYFLRDELEHFDPQLLIPKKCDVTMASSALGAAIGIISSIGVENATDLEASLRELAEKNGWKAGQLFMPIRVAVTGRTESPGLFDTLRVIGLKRVLQRLDNALHLLTDSSHLSNA